MISSSLQDKVLVPEASSISEVFHSLVLLVCQALLLHQLQDLNRWELPCFHSIHLC